ncbi:MAG: dephospho-CoA kinase [Pseudomonadota bacterium]|jgi:dephospho-CoA kinase
MQPHTIWGLTGGIGSGKSTVAGILATCGATIVDADAISRSLTAASGAAIPAIKAAFGDAAIDANGAMDRDWMRARVFSDPDSKSRLEGILHPLIGLHTEAAILNAPTKWVICDVPLLVESAHWRAKVQGVWVVDCSVQTQINRVKARNQWSDAMVQAVIDKQVSRAQRLKSADIVTFNDGLSLQDLSSHVTTQSKFLGIR